MNRKRRRLKYSNVGPHPIRPSRSGFMYHWNLLCCAAMYYSTKFGCMLHYSEHNAQVVPVVAIKACMEGEEDIAPHILWFFTRM
jgi:hypothetical protein